MHSSRSIDQMNPRKISKLFLNPLSSCTRLHNPHKDPFEGLSIKKPCKLLPVIPSAIQLPRIQSSLNIRPLKKQQKAKTLIFLSPKHEKIKFFSKFIEEKNEMLIPKTPRERLKKKYEIASTNSAILAKKKISETNSEEFSFGNDF